MLLTLAAAYGRRSARDQDGLQPPTRPTRSVDAEPAATGRCAISHARFGGNRAQLVKVVQAGVTSYVVIEVGKPDPLVRRQRGHWLRAAYGDAERAWLGEFGSAEAAMLRAARLCPPAMRCWPGEADCGPQSEALTPARAFLRH